MNIPSKIPEKYDLDLTTDEIKVGDMVGRIIDYEY